MSRAGTSGGRGLYALVSAAVVGLDQLVKFVIHRALDLNDSRSIVDGLVSLTYVQNRGAAFGLLSDAELPHQPVLFTAVSLGALLAIGLYAWRVPAHHRLPQWALALVMGGAVGNLIDRARLGYVIDFVDVYWGAHHWPAFNVADSAISVGVGLLILDILRAPRASESSARVPAPSPGGNE